MSSSGTASPAFAVLDVVSIAAIEPFLGAGLSGEQGAIIGIRRYPDGSYVYSVGSIRDDPDADDDDVPGLYGEDQLRQTGLRTTSERYGPNPPFQMRDVVLVSAECDVGEVRGLYGYVDTAYSPGPASEPLGIWVEQLEESFIVDARYLSRTGERVPLPPLPGAKQSTLVSTTGEVIGSASYVVVDDIHQYL